MRTISSSLWMESPQVENGAYQHYHAGVDVVVALCCVTHVARDTLH